MAKPLIKAGKGYIYRDKIAWFKTVQAGTQWEVHIKTIDGASHVFPFDTEAKAEAAIETIVNETEVDIVEDI